MAMRN